MMLPDLMSLQCFIVGMIVTHLLHLVSVHALFAYNTYKFLETNIQVLGFVMFHILMTVGCVC